MLPADRIRKIVDDVLRDKLGAFGYETVEIEEGRDFDDQPALFLKGIMREGASRVPGDVLNAAFFAASRELENQEEERFPYFSLTRKNEEAVEPMSNREIR